MIFYNHSLDGATGQPSWHNYLGPGLTDLECQRWAGLVYLSGSDWKCAVASLVTWTSHHLPHMKLIRDCAMTTQIVIWPWCMSNHMIISVKYVNRTLTLPSIHPGPWRFKIYWQLCHSR